MSSSPALGRPPPLHLVTPSHPPLQRKEQFKYKSVLSTNSLDGESQSHHRNRGPRFAERVQTRRAWLWTVPRATETPRSFPPPGNPRPSGPLQLPTSSLVLRPHSIPLSSRSLHWPAASSLLHPRSRHLSLARSQGSPRASGLPQQPETPAWGGGSGWAGAYSTSDTRGREGGGSAHFIIGHYL